MAIKKIVKRKPRVRASVAGDMLNGAKNLMGNIMATPSIGVTKLKGVIRKGKLIHDTAESNVRKKNPGVGYQVGGELVSQEMGRLKKLLKKK